VHPGDVVPLEEVVGVKDEVAVKPLSPILLLDLVQQEVQGVALAHPELVEPLEDHGPGVPGHLGGAVGAVVRHHEGGHKVRGVVLPGDGVQKLADDRLLVPGGDEHSVAVELLRRRVFLPADGQGYGNIEELIEVANDKQDAQHASDMLKQDQISHYYHLSWNRQMAQNARSPRPLTARAPRKAMAAKAYSPIPRALPPTVEVMMEGMRATALTRIQVRSRMSVRPTK